MGRDRVFADMERQSRNLRAEQDMETGIQLLKYRDTIPSPSPLAQPPILPTPPVKASRRILYRKRMRAYAPQKT